VGVRRKSKRRVESERVIDEGVTSNNKLRRGKQLRRDRLSKKKKQM